jgi:PAS domain S-box-containing protein
MSAECPNFPMDTRPGIIPIPTGMDMDNPSGPHTTPMALQDLQPTYFLIDRNLSVVEKGGDVLSNLPSDTGFHDLFEILRPSLPGQADFDILAALGDRIFLLRCRSTKPDICLRGAFMPAETHGMLMFYGRVWKEPGELSQVRTDEADLADADLLTDRSAPKPEAEMAAGIERLNRTDRELLREKLRFEAVFQYSTIAILVSDGTGRIVLANRMAGETFAYPAQDLEGLAIEDLIPARYRERHVGYRNRYHQSPVNRTMGLGLDLHARRRDGSEFPVEISLGHYQTEEGRFVIAYVIDISRRKKIEQEVRDQQQEMARVNREIEELNAELEAKVEQRTHQLQETLAVLQHSRDELEKALSKEKELSDLKSRFVSMASHEFRTPLSTILSSASLVGKYTLSEDQSKRDKHIQRIRSAVSNLTDILNEFLSIGKIEEGRIQVNPSEFNLRQHAELVCNEMQTILKPGQRIRVRHKGAETVTLDLSLLRNIIINLVSNAIKFSPEAAAIDVETEVDGGRTTIRVRDHGIGISEEDRKHLFERFFRGKNATNIQGTGLGLHIVSKYAELMHGSIGVESELEQGTTFTVQFDA